MLDLMCTYVRKIGLLRFTQKQTQKSKQKQLAIIRAATAEEHNANNSATKPKV